MSTPDKPAGMGGVIAEANKGLKTPFADDIRERQKEALAVSFTPPSKMGRPSEYDNETMPLRVFNWLTNRDVIFTKKMIAGRLGVSESTFRLWCSKHDDLSAAIAQGLAEQEGWLATQMASGMKYSASMYAVLKNLHEWKETQETTHKLSIGEALEQQRTGARRVDWDRSRPDPLRPAPVIDAQLVTPPSPSTQSGDAATQAIQP